MKKLICVLFVMMIALSFAVTAAAAGPEPEITLQPQNYNIPVGSTVVYRVEAQGENLTATWYIEFMGQTCEITQGMASEQWRAYVGEESGPTRDGNNFYCNLTKVQPELAGARVWCEIEDGHYLVKSAKAYVMVDGTAAPPEIRVPAFVKAYQNEDVTVTCELGAPEGTGVTYLWYETPTGELMDMRAVDRGAEVGASFKPDTSEIGTKYYICMVETPDGGRAYSSAIKVEVVEGEPVVTENADTETEAPDTEDTAEAPESKGEIADTDKPGEVISAPTEVGVTTTGAAGSSLPLWAVIALAACAAVIASLVTILIYKSKKK